MSLVYDQILIKRVGGCRNSAPKACRPSELVTAYFTVDTMQTKTENALDVFSRYDDQQRIAVFSEFDSHSSAVKF